MAKFTGRQQEVGVAREATRGTLVVPAFWIPKVSYNVEDKVQKAKFLGNYGVLAGGDAAPVTQQWAEGDLELELTDKILGILLYGLFGTLTTGSFNSVYKHTLTIQNSVQPTTLSLWMNDPINAAETPTKSLGYAMGMVNSFEMKVELGELVKGTFGFVAKSHTDFTRQTPSYAAGNKFAHNHLSFKIAANTASLDAASKINLQSLQLKIERAVIRENALGTVQPVDILARQFKITGKIGLTYQARTYRDYMLNGTTKAMRIALNNSSVTIGATTPQFQLDLPIVHFEAWEPKQDLDEVAMQELNFEALYDVSNGILVGANTFVVNAQASY